MTGDALVFVMIPVLLEGCCVQRQLRDRAGLQQETTAQRFRAVEGETFMMQCGDQNTEVLWSKSSRDETPASTQSGRSEDDAALILSRSNHLSFPAVEVKHSGTYMCLSSSGREFLFHLQVVQHSSVMCSVTLNLASGGYIPCPGLTCSDPQDSTAVSWYKGTKSVCELQQARLMCEGNGLLHIRTVRNSDAAVYFCDRQTREEGLSWTVRRAVRASAIPWDRSSPPRILHPHPDGNQTDEVEVGRSHTLTCTVIFGFERKVSYVIQWYVSAAGRMEGMIPLQMESHTQQENLGFTEHRVTRQAIIKEVTSLDLNHTYTCVANSAAGNSSTTVRLRRKRGVRAPAVFVCPVVSLLLLVAGLGITLHVKWLEVTLIYRSHCGRANMQKGHKEEDFDVLLSYVWSSSAPEADEEDDEEAGPPCSAFLSSPERLSSEEGSATQGPPERLLARVLEDQWGYRLCLLERDLLPGGAFTQDVVDAIQRSRMLICLLSADFLCNSNAVFVLESGIQALLQNSHIFLLLIWTSRPPAALSQLDPPLPPLVQRSLKVLPSLNWTSGKPGRATRTFWSSLRKTLPAQRSAALSAAQEGSV
ncbi:interleukin-18 receptor accessory protein-like isoform X2 [Genypterus blacodes]|uniref:interleukin-18 receptor accessory protein-like isoform X2 n=1 Tax=Genypterus blacodes TaxID=154954 RepID=UPI003F75DABC